MLDNAPYILRMTRDGSALRLFVDRDYALTGQFGEQPVLELVLEAPAELERLTASRLVGQHISIEKSPTGVTLWLEFGNDYEEVRCESVEERYHDYSAADLLEKVKRVLASLEHYAEAYGREYKRHSRLKSALQTLAVSQLDRAERRLEFFGEESSFRASRAEGTAEAYRRVLSVLDSESVR